MTKKSTKVTMDDDGGMNDFWEAAEAVGKTKVTVQKDGRPTEMSIETAVLQKLAASALSGSVQSIRQFNELQRLAAENKQRDIKRSVAIWRAFKQIQRKKYADHLKKHGCEPLDFPHPDDIWIDDRTGVQIRGPIDHDEYIAMQHTKRVIDACLWQDALEQRINRLSREDDPPSGGLLLAGFLNQTLPRREQLSETDMTLRMMRREGRSKRHLLKETRQAWLEAGYVFKRGATLWPAQTIASLIRMLPDALRICNADDLDEEKRIQALQDMIQRRMVWTTD